MKKSEMDKLRELVKLWNQAIYSPLYAAATPLSDLLDTFEVDPPSAKESTSIHSLDFKEIDAFLDNMKKENETELIDAGYKKEMHGSTPILTKPIEVVSPKRKWHKWSELKDKFFTKKQQKETKEQAVEQSCMNCKNKDNCKPFDRTECFCHCLSMWEKELADQVSICPDCEGEGIIVSYGYEPDPTKTCPKCKGTGYKENKDERPN
jgi:hypothetical protein